MYLSFGAVFHTNCAVMCHPDPSSIKDFLSQLLGVPSAQSLKDCLSCKEPPQPRLCPVVGVQVEGTYPIIDQCRSAPVQDTLESFESRVPREAS